MARVTDHSSRWHRYWDKKSRTYDKEMAFWDKRFFGDSREWACSQAAGTVLEVAIGTGLNLLHYRDDIDLTGVDLSERMLDIARARASELGRTVTLQQANAHELPFRDATFDTVICTFGLCAIPDTETAVNEMVRVLRPGGRLILLDHVKSTSRLVRALQRLLELISVPLAGEHFLRRPSQQLKARGLTIDRRERFKAGLVERMVARKPPNGN